MAQRTAQRSTSERRAETRGLRVIAFLAVLTLIEYAIAISLASAVGLMVLLSFIALVKAWLIVTYFMHLPLVWRKDGGH